MSLAARLRAGETVFTAWSTLPDALTVEALTETGFDAVTLDMQHGGHHEDSVVRGIGPVLAAGKPPLVRIPVGRFDMASRALDFGAQAVIAPMVNSVEDAKTFALSMKYPPAGKRSWGPHFAVARSRYKGDAWMADANRDTLAFAMIETREALDIVGDILDEPGIDGVFVGPSDFSIAWTNGATVNPNLPEMRDAIAHIAQRANEAGKLAGIYVVDPALVAGYVAMGYGLIAIGSEQVYMNLGVSALLNAARNP